MIRTDISAAAKSAVKQFEKKHAPAIIAEGVGNAATFKRGDIVRYAPAFCGEGERHYLHVVLESFPDVGRAMIFTLNSPLVFGASERVDFDMIELYYRE